MEVIKDIAELTPTAQKACNAFFHECEQQGLDVFYTNAKTGSFVVGPEVN